MFDGTKEFQDPESSTDCDNTAYFAQLLSRVIDLIPATQKRFFLDRLVNDSGAWETMRLEMRDFNIAQLCVIAPPPGSESRLSDEDVWDPVEALLHAQRHGMSFVRPEPAARAHFKTASYRVHELNGDYGVWIAWKQVRPLLVR